MLYCTGTVAQNSLTTVGDNNFHTIFVEYNPVTFNVDVSGAKNENYTTFSLGYSGGVAFGKNSPFLLNDEFSVQYLHESDYGNIKDMDYNMLSGKIAMNVLYKIDVAENQFQLFPYAGLLFRGDFINKLKYDNGKKSESWSLINEEDAKKIGYDKEWKSMFLGWQAGVKMCIANHLILGVAYGRDFWEITKNVTVSELSVKLGYTF